MGMDLSEYKDLFLEASRENLRLLNDSLLVLEKNSTDATAIADIFRAAHSLKGESAAMEYNQTAYLCHVVEDAFAAIRDGHAQATPELADMLFRCFDAIGASLNNIEQHDAETENLPAISEELKKLTGVQTEGVGKTAPKDQPATPPAVTTPTATSEPIPTEKLKIKTLPVRVDQLDAMMSLIEELVVDRLVLKQLVHELNNKQLRAYYEKAGRTSDSLQFQVMKIRAVPIKMVFDHFPRTVRDLARTLNKQIELVVEGQDLELDRTIVERLDEPLTHLIRNAADHGLGATGGTITLKAQREQDYAVIEVTDNGDGVNWKALAAKAGIPTTDPEKLKELLFSGISTAEKVTEISGRGVGLGAVKKDVQDFCAVVGILNKTLSPHKATRRRCRAFVRRFAAKQTPTT